MRVGSRSLGARAPVGWAIALVAVAVLAAIVVGMAEQEGYRQQTLARMAMAPRLNAVPRLMDPFVAPPVSEQLKLYGREVEQGLRAGGLLRTVTVKPYYVGVQIILPGKEVIDPRTGNLNRTGLAILKRVGRAMATESCRVAVDVDVLASQAHDPYEDWMRASTLGSKVAEVIARSGKIDVSRFEVKAQWGSSSQRLVVGHGAHRRARDVVVWLKEPPFEFHWAPPPPTPSPNLPHKPTLMDYASPF